MIPITGAIVWASCRPVIKLILTISVGAILARTNVLDLKGSKMIANMMIWILYPSLLFTSVIAGIDSKELNSLGIMIIASFFILVLGCLLGFIIMKLTNPPMGFRYGCISKRIEYN